MAMTLNDLTRQSKSPLQKYVLQNLLRDSPLRDLIPFYDVDSLSSIVVRWNTLPSVGHRKVGGGYTESTGKTEQVTEGVYAAGGDILFDRVFDKVKNTIEDPKQTQVNMKIKAIEYQLKNDLINGDHSVDADGPEGLNKRIASYLPSRQSVATSSAAYDATAAAANSRYLIGKLEELADLAGLRAAPNATTLIGKERKAMGFKSGAFLLNRTAYLGVGRALRLAGVLDQTKDSQDRIIRTFQDIPLIDVGLKADQSTEIILDTYGASSNETRIFCVRFAQNEGDDGFAAIQLQGTGPDVYDPVAEGETAPSNNGPQKALRIDWWYGFCGWGSYYASRLTGLKAASGWTE